MRDIHSDESADEITLLSLHNRYDAKAERVIPVDDARYGAGDEVEAARL